ncbi:uncharacterized protein ASPGLDRAFT_43005 [Aspergillus glaucus CBS 516.65]|uniref:Uncharacterized protein n=1 Tax=Aspergillus glaucus CBS 516.65 TaxID=1160497 RepID=A0A1L9VVJ7_ASPGL|nr:hypothetical protein ASPGLDRAFT_43005 [Aspergillus glaucus CBS 516.65]OJJ87929.1 hypothetical protein ASPGLDRAFT_43005 [Aspergillus glaucus CBS 516.65]
MSCFQPVHYVPASRQAQILAMPVKRILAVPHRKAGGTSSPLFAFWRDNRHKPLANMAYKKYI